MKSKILTSKTGREYTITKKIGEGGQGKIFLVKGGKYALKVIGKSSFKNREIENKFTYLKRLDIFDLPIAKPIDLLSPPYVGYVMEMATGMISLSSLINIPKDKQANIIDWFIETGGLKRRVLILEKLAYILNNLHSKRLIYGDLSPENVFISKNTDFNEVFLIDTDNIRNKASIKDTVYTPFYGAPELVNTNGVMNTYTDAYSFAVIAFKILTLNHPLIGYHVNDGEPELEEEALQGKIPWVFNNSDDINFTDEGLPYDLFCSKSIQKAFNQTFDAGLNIYSGRTTISNWYEILNTVKNYILECDSCGFSYYFDKKNKKCPKCEKNNPIYHLAFYRKEEILKRIKAKPYHHIFFTKEVQLFGVDFLLNNDKEICVINATKNNIKLEIQDEIYITKDFDKEKPKSKQETNSYTIPKSDLKKYCIHYKAFNEEHRIALISKIN